MKKILALVASLGIVVAAPLSASANTAPESYTPAHGAYRNVATADRIYFETFGENSSEYDDDSILYIPAGVTCEDNSVTATGPFLISDEQNPTCTNDSDSSAYTVETDNSTGKQGLPIGFGINFFGTTYTKAWPNTNSGLMFDGPDSAYNNSMGGNADDAGSSNMAVFNADLGFLKGTSAFWTAQTTINGHQAVVFSWDKFIMHSDSGASNLSFQIVLIDRGSGDFDVEFNYDSLTGTNDNGWDGPGLWVDLASDLTVGSNIIHSDDAASFFTNSDCIDVSNNTFGDTRTASNINNVSYVKKESNTSFSVWDNDTCTSAVNIDAVQDVANDNYYYYEFYAADYVPTIAAGWSTYNSTNFKISWFDFNRNVSWEDSLNGGAHALVSGKLNSTVVGRYFFGQRDGATVSDPSALGVSNKPSLANTGADFTAALAAGSGLVLAGVLMVLRRRASKI